ncbi:hypothetical protein G3M58_07635 [Streptomyces sp. SID7499]|uniref:Uncharacterized protein n=1 Tax=Streptomyces sp. SID7499 TaxID=2706086 RepID=A0A6G3WLI3_9ACTN|nr:hypothetical protein [Streptomyces sp. SID7499]
MRPVTGGAACRAPREPVAAVGAHQPVEGGVHQSPVVPVGFGDDHLGQGTLPVVARGGVPLAQERGPGPLDDAVHQVAAGGTGRGTAVRPAAALRTAA